MKKLILYLILFISLLSCDVKHKIYREPRGDPNQRDKYSEYCQTCLFVILDKSLAENKVFITESKNTKFALFPDNKSLSDTIYYNKLVPKKIKNDCEEIIKVSNFRAVEIFVEKDTVLVRDFTFPLYRFVVITKKNKHKRPTYIYTNDISSYPKVVEKLSKEIPEITLP